MPIFPNGDLGQTPDGITPVDVSPPLAQNTQALSTENQIKANVIDVLKRGKSGEYGIGTTVIEGAGHTAVRATEVSHLIV